MNAQENPYHAPAAPPPLPPSLLPGPCMTPYGHPPATTADERTLAMLCHLLAIFTGFLGPLILWLVRKDTSPFIDHHGREALNFQITVFIITFGLSMVTAVLMLVLIGIFLVPVILVLVILAFVAEIMACVAANRGEWHRYPFTIRLV